MVQGYHKALTVLLIVYIGIFCFLFFALPERSFSAAENRFLQTRPVLSRQKLLSGQFSQAAEKYLADQFVLRDSWIRLKACFELLLQKMDHRGVYFGRDGYLLQKPQRREKEQLEQNISAVSNFAQQAGKSVYFLLAPVSAQILREKLPRYAVPPIVEPSAVREEMTADIIFVDPSALLCAHKQENIYYKTDHHWTSRGAYYAYQELGKAMGFKALPEDSFVIKQVSDNFYGSLASQSGYRCQPDNLQLFLPKVELPYTVEYVYRQKTSTTVYAWEHLRQKDQYAVFLDGNHALIKITTENQTGRRLLVVKDSYANALVPFLIPHFSEIHLLDLRYFHHQVKDYLLQNEMTEILFVYNTITFAEETSLRKLSSR
jgi:hypothetical protein